MTRHCPHCGEKAEMDVLDTWRYRTGEDSFECGWELRCPKCKEEFIWDVS